MIYVDTELIREMVSNGKRIDHREENEYRKIKIEKGVIPKAEGSARARIGETEVIAGIKMDIGEPYPDRPNEGVMIVNAEFVPLAFSEFESGPPGEESIELSRVVDRAIRESKALDTEKLCIEQGKKVWMVFVDLDVVDHDGNLIDAASLAAIAALLDAKMPKLEVVEENGERKYMIDYGTKTKKLPVKEKPVNVTFAKFGDKIVVDPSFVEEEAMDARLTFGIMNGKISSMQKGGSGGFTIGEIEKMADMAIKKGDELRNMI